MAPARPEFAGICRRGDRWQDGLPVSGIGGHMDLSGTGDPHCVEKPDVPAGHLMTFFKEDLHV